MQLKRWESPRRQGRNHKGKGGAARQRQLKKQHKLWCKKLKQQSKANDHLAGKDVSPSFFSVARVEALALRGVPELRGFKHTEHKNLIF